MVATSHRSTFIDVTVFFALAIALCFACAVPLVFRLIPEDANNLIVPILQLTPCAAALAVWAATRTATFRDSFATSWRGAGGWIAAGVAVITVIAGLQTLLALSMGIWTLQPTGAIIAASAWIIPVFAMQSAFAIGEEFGWRGWLATRAQSWGFWKLSIVSGLVWIVWHLPVLAIIGDRGAWDIVIYFAGMLPWAPLLLALRLRSQSVWPAVFAHGAINSVRVFLLQSVPNPTDHLLIEVVGWVLTVAVAAWLMRGRRETRRAR